MAITEGDYIRLEYTGSVDDIVFDTTSAEAAKEAGIENPSATYGPILVRVGSGHVIPGLDEALVGREAGEEGEIEVPPEKGFGGARPRAGPGRAAQAVRREGQVGSRVKNDNREGVVRDIIGSRAIVDYNNEFAGKTLHYTFRIVEVVENEAERANGLVRLFSGREASVKAQERRADLRLPAGISCDRRWMLWKPTIVRDILEAAPSVKEIRMLETFKRPEPAPEPAAEEAPAE